MGEQLFPPTSNWRVEQTDTTVPRDFPDEYDINNGEMVYTFSGEADEITNIGHFVTTDAVDVSGYATVVVDIEVTRSSTDGHIRADVRTMTDGKYNSVKIAQVGPGDDSGAQTKTETVRAPFRFDAGGAKIALLADGDVSGEIRVTNVTAIEWTEVLYIHGCRMEPEQATVGETVELGVHVMNESDYFRRFGISVTVDGEVVKLSSESISDGGEEYFIYEIEAGEAGEYDVGVAMVPPE